MIGTTIWVMSLVVIGLLYIRGALKVYIALSKEKHKNKQGKARLFLYVFIITLIGIIIITIILNIIVYNSKIEAYTLPDWLTVPTGNLDVWIGFFGSLFGAIIGGLITLYVLSKTINEQKINTIKLIEAERMNTKDILQRYDKQLESQFKPCLDVYLKDNNSEVREIKCSRNDYREKKSINLIIKNIRSIPVIDVRIARYETQKILENGIWEWKRNDKEQKSFLMPIGNLKELGILSFDKLKVDIRKEISIHCILVFRNVLGETYKLNFTISVTHPRSFKPGEDLIIKIYVTSEPMKVDKKDVPGLYLEI
ncbi:hypothetical protein IMX26_13150 [Clostridium sp. 'deep sea']|uniref:hypothetical protein n=1 Tax=Clostridium sp. 'deep sea' TaxID=2779445 RepID=UPI0018969322|nr:hypothetical protein [Clostridium sp. 'deep sea']QOR34430.1 hypothetical protein IMX26_13150 [Clostridium sp. 'deep sea']